MEGSDGLRKIPRGNITSGRLIGTGGFGNVLKGEYNKGEIVALKILHTPIRVEKYHEFNIISQFKHRNLVGLIGIVDIEPNECPELVFQYIPNGNLLEFVQKNSCSKKTLIKVASDIINGMEYLHNLHYPHRTLAARNILMDTNCNAKISDYGMSKVLDGHGSNYYQIDDERILPIRWIPKECIPSNSNNTNDSAADSNFSFRVDIWSFGVVLWEAWTKGDVPYGAACSNTQVRQLIMNGSNPLKENPPDSCPGVIIKVMESIFQDDPEKRPTFMDLRKTFDGLGPKPTKKPEPEQRNISETNIEDQTQEKNIGSENTTKQQEKVKSAKKKGKSQQNANFKKPFESESGKPEGETSSSDQLPKSHPVYNKNDTRKESGFNKNHSGYSKEKDFGGQSAKPRQYFSYNKNEDGGKGKYNQGPRGFPKSYHHHNTPYNRDFREREREPRERDFRPNMPHSSSRNYNSGPAPNSSGGTGNFSQHQAHIPPLFNNQPLFPPQMQPPFMNNSNPSPAMMYPNYVQPGGMGYNPMQAPMYPQPQMQQSMIPQGQLPLQVTVNQGSGPSSERNLEQEVKNLQETVKRLESLQLESQQQKPFEANFPKSNSKQYFDGPRNPQHNYVPEEHKRDFPHQERRNVFVPKSGRSTKDNSQYRPQMQKSNDEKQKMWIPSEQQQGQYPKRDQFHAKANQNPNYSSGRSQNPNEQYQNQNSASYTTEQVDTNRMVGDVTAAAVAAAVRGAIKAAKSASDKASKKD